MNKFGIVSSIAIVTGICIYAMILLSSNNTCSGVRVFDCQKAEKLNLVSNEKYNELKPTGDLFLHYCSPKIIDNVDNYLIDYSDCALKINVLKDKPWVQGVTINGTDLTRDQINSNF